MSGLLGKLFSSKERSTKRKRSSSKTMKHSMSPLMHQSIMNVMPVLPSITQRNGNYHSKQMHVQFVNGVTEERQQIVDVHRNKGTKTVIVTRNGKTQKSTKSLSPKEITCIRKCKFMPGLFNECDKCIR